MSLHKVTKIGSTDPNDIRELGDWVLDPNNAQQLKNMGLELVNASEMQSNYVPATDAVDAIRNKIKKSVVVEDKSESGAKEVIELVNPLDDETGDLEQIEDEKTETAPKTETNEAEVVETEQPTTQPKKRGPKPKAKATV